MTAGMLWTVCLAWYWYLVLCLYVIHYYLVRSYKTGSLGSALHGCLKYFEKNEIIIASIKTRCCDIQQNNYKSVTRFIVQYDLGLKVLL